MANLLKNQVVFVQIPVAERVIVDEKKIQVNHNHPDWKKEERIQYEKAQVLDYSAIQFYLDSSDGIFTITVNKNDKEKAMKLLENIK